MLKLDVFVRMSAKMALGLRVEAAPKVLSGWNCVVRGNPEVLVLVRR